METLLRKSQHRTGFEPTSSWSWDVRSTVVLQPQLTQKNFQPTVILQKRVDCSQSELGPKLTHQKIIKGRRQKIVKMSGEKGEKREREKESDEGGWKETKRVSERGKEKEACICKHALGWVILGVWVWVLLRPRERKRERVRDWENKRYYQTIMRLCVCVCAYTPLALCAYWLLVKRESASGVRFRDRQKERAIGKLCCK